MSRLPVRAARGLIWDLDGVIADTASFHFRAWRELAKDRGIAFSEADFKQTFGKRNPEIIAEKFGTDIPTAEAETLAQRKETTFRKLAGESVEPFPGAKELMLSAKKAGWKMALASSTPVENIELVTRALGIGDLFDAVVSDRDVVRGKPDPEAFLLAAERLGVPPGKCIVIEDAVAGVEGAKNAGMKCVAVTNTHPAARLQEADKIVGTLEMVTVDMLESLLR